MQELDPELARIIDRIEEIRKVNNARWMDLIRLCYRAAPDEAKQIFREIEKNDSEIVELGRRSASL